MYNPPAIPMKSPRFVGETLIPCNNQWIIFYQFNHHHWTVKTLWMMAETLLLLVNPLFWMLKPCETPYISRGEKKVFFDDGSLILHDSMIQPLFLPEKTPFFDDGDINQPPAPPASSWQPPAGSLKAPPARRRGRSLGTSGARSWEETMVITFCTVSLIMISNYSIVTLII